MTPTRAEAEHLVRAMVEALVATVPGSRRQRQRLADRLLRPQPRPSTDNERWLARLPRR